MGTKADARILVWEGASLWIVSAPAGQQYPRTDFHAHHAVQLTFALTGLVEFDGEAGRVSGVAIAIAPDAPHAFKGTGRAVHLFVASDSQAGREIRRALFSNGPIAHMPEALLGGLPARLQSTFEDPTHTDEDLQTIGRQLITHIAGEASRAERLDPRIAKLIAWVSARLDQAVSLGDVAAVVGLSAGRTRHLFVEQTGISFRTYLLWLRLMRAVEMFGIGASLTEAAHSAGFADSAHLSRTFRRMFGIAAVTLRVAVASSIRAV